MTNALLSLENLKVEFKTPRGLVSAVNSIDLQLGHSEVFGLIGESGSGKSVTLRAIMRILPPKITSITGKITMNDKDVLALNKDSLAAYRGGETSMIFQEPATALDPVFTIGQQIIEAIRCHSDANKHEARTRALEMLELVKIPSAKLRLDNYPHELSGGMRQRAMIALALSTAPKLLLADEPTTALDATVQLQVILLLRELQKELRMSTIFVTHDIGVAAEIADKIGVMYAGRIVEFGTASEVIKSPQHPYTKGLLSSTVHGATHGEPIKAIEGMPPDLVNMPVACAFAPRCSIASEKCHNHIPDLVKVSSSHSAACIYVKGS